METSVGWSELPFDILRSVLGHLNDVDFHSAKTVCPNWYSCSKQTSPRKTTSPWLILFTEDDDDCALLYNPYEAKSYRTKRDFSGTRFFANSRNWFLMLDSKSNLYIIDVFTEKRFNLPSLESLKGDNYTLKRLGDNEVMEQTVENSSSCIRNAEKNLRGLLWVDEKKEEYVVVWYFDNESEFIGFCKNGEDRYRDIPTCMQIQSVSDTVQLRDGDRVYLLADFKFFQKLDLSKLDRLLSMSAPSDLKFLL